MKIFSRIFWIIALAVSIIAINQYLYHKEFNSNLKLVLKDLSSALENTLSKRSIVKDPEDAELELASGKIKTKKYGLNLKIAEIPDMIEEVVETLKSKPEFKDNLVKVVDSLKAALEKDDRYKDFYEEKEVGKETFEKDIEQVKASIELFFTDEKTQNEFKKNIAEMKKNFSQSQGFSVNVDVYLDDKQILRAQDISIDTPIALIKMMAKIEAINSEVKDMSVEMSKDQIEYDPSNPSVLNEFKPETKENLKKILLIGYVVLLASYLLVNLSL